MSLRQESSQGENRCHCARKARERGMTLDVGNLSKQPCGSTNPARPGLAKQPEASLAWGGAILTAKRRQRVSRLCDRAPKFYSWESSLLTRAGTMSNRRDGLARSVLPGSKNSGRETFRGAREPGRPCRFHRQFPAREPDDQLPGAHDRTLRSLGANSGVRVVPPWRRQRSRAG